MLSAFTARPIVELRASNKFRIESILAYNDRLLVGLSTGTLRVYRINEVPDNGAPKDPTTESPKQKTAELLSEKDKFSKYKIEQLALIKEANILVALSNAFVSLYDLKTYELQEQLSKTRGASALAVTSNIVKDPASGVLSIVSRLAVAVKRRLLLWSWQDMELEDGGVELALPSGIKSLTWADGTHIMVGLNSNYLLVNVDTQETVPIVGPGSIGGNSAQESGRLGGMGVGTMNYMGIGGVVPRPLATSLGEGEMLLAKDVNTHFISREGEPLGRRQIPWRVAPEAIGYSYPYLLSLQEATKGTLEVRNPVTLTLLQSISLPSANLLHVAQPNISLAHAGKGFLVASERSIWRMGALGYDSQIDALVDEDHFDEAISLLGMLEDALLRDKEGRLREIKMRKAQKLFDDGSYQESLDLFTEVAAPPERVIRLYPKVVSGGLAHDQQARDKSAEPQTPVGSHGSVNHKKTASVSGSVKTPRKGVFQSFLSPSKGDEEDTKSETGSGAPDDGLSGKQLKTAVRALQGFLADVRRRLQPFFNHDQTLKDVSDVQIYNQKASSDQVLEYLLGLSSLENIDRGARLTEVATLVDTTLFRAHMYASPYLVGSLFRIPNFCDPDVVMGALEAKKRNTDLIEFLFGKRLHRQALERLAKFGQSSSKSNKKGEDESDPLHGPARTVAYLQNLGAEHIDLILDFAGWPLQEDAQMGMEIFTADTENAESLPRIQVLNFLEKVSPALALQYLEHVVHELNDQTPALHQRLLNLYFEAIQQAPREEKATEHTNDPSDAETQARFISLLRTSAQYSPARLLSTLPRSDPRFHEARAVVFAKMGQHRQALEIYVFALNDASKAEEYCNAVHLANQSKKGERNDQESVYLILLGLYLNPPPSHAEDETPDSTSPKRPKMPKQQQQKQPSPPTKRVQEALGLLARHGPRLPAAKTLDLIPPGLLVRDLEFYFRGRVRAANGVVARGEVESGLRRVEAVRVQSRLLGARGRRVRVDEERVCGVCFKRLGGSVVSVFPDNSVVHLGCASRKQQQLQQQ